MKRLELLINGTFLMDGVNANGGGGSSTLDEQQRQAEVARKAQEAASNAGEEAPGDVGEDSSATKEADRPTKAADAKLLNKPGTDKSTLAGDLLNNDSTKESIAKPFDFAIDFANLFGGKPASKSLLDTVGDKVINPDLNGGKGAATNADGKPVAESQLNEAETAKLAEARDASGAQREDSVLTKDQEELKAKFDNYDPKANDGFGGTKDGVGSRALHFTDDSKSILLDCSDKDCNPGNLVKEDGDNKGDYQFGKGEKATFLKAEDVNTAFDSHKGIKPEVKADSTKTEPTLAKSAKAATDAPVPQPEAQKIADAEELSIPEAKMPEKEGADNANSLLNEALKGTGFEDLNELDKTKEDMLEKAGILDGQKHANNMYAKKGNSLYMASKGPGGNMRFGKIAESKIGSEGVNLGAGKGWESVSAEEQKDLQTAFDKRQDFYKAFSEAGDNAKDGYNNYKKVEDLRGRIDNLQDASKDAKDSGSLSSLNDLRKEVNALKDLTGFDAVDKKFNDLLAGDDGKLAKTEVEKRASELTELGFKGDDKLATDLKAAGGDTTKQREAYDNAINRHRDSMHAFSNDANSTSHKSVDAFNKSISELEKSYGADLAKNPEAKALLDHIKRVAGSKNADAKGAYLEAELANLKSHTGKIDVKREADKRAEEGSRGTSEAINFEGEGFKGLEKSLGAKTMKEVFGENYSKEKDNEALKGAIEDFEAIKGDNNSEAILKDLLKTGTYDKSSDAYRNLQEANNAASPENLKKLSEQITEANTNIKDAGDNQEAKDAAEKEKATLVAQKTKLETAQTSIKKLAEVAKKYGNVKVDGKDQVARSNGKELALLADGTKGTVKDGVFEAVKTELSKEEKLSNLKELIKIEYKDSNVNMEKLFALKGDVSVVSGYTENSQGEKDFWCEPCKGLAGTDTFKALTDISNKYGDQLGFKFSDTNQGNSHNVPNVTHNGGTPSVGTDFIKNLAADGSKFEQNFARNKGYGVLS